MYGANTTSFLFWRICPGSEFFLLGDFLVKCPFTRSSPFLIWHASCDRREFGNLMFPSWSILLGSSSVSLDVGLSLFFPWFPLFWVLWLLYTLDINGKALMSTHWRMGCPFFGQNFPIWWPKKEGPANPTEDFLFMKMAQTQHISRRKKLNLWHLNHSFWDVTRIL